MEKDAMILRSLLFVIAVLPSVFGLADDSEDNPAFELVEVMNGSLIAGAVGTQFDLVSKTETFTEFDDGIVSVEEIVYRLELDEENKFVRWVLKGTKDDAPGRNAPSPGNMILSSVEVRGTTLTRRDDTGAKRQEHASFGEAMAAADLRLPGFYGVIRFPFPGNRPQEFKRLQAMVMNPKTTVRKTKTADGLKFTARYEEAPERFDIHTWQFRLPDYAATMFTVDRAIKLGELKRYWTQETFWESVQDRTVPFRVASETVTVRRNDKGFDIGAKKTDAAFAWLSIGQEIKQGPEVSSSVEMLRHLDEGEKLAKARASR
jgi:hypothetical protein